MVRPAQTSSPFRLVKTDGHRLRDRFAKIAGTVAEKALGLSLLDRLYEVARLPDPSVPGAADKFLERAFRVLKIDLDLPEGSLERVPTEGSLLVVANHPFGAVEGLLLAAMLRRIRPDVKFLANHLLGRIPELRELFFLVDPFGNDSSAKSNRAPMRDAMRWLKDGGALAVFPSGEVSHRDWKHKTVVDPEWSETIGRMQRRAKAPVVPVYFGGANGKVFQMAGMVHPLLRTALLPRQLINKRGCHFPARIGALIPAQQLARFESDRELVDYLRLRTYILGKGETKGGPGKQRHGDEHSEHQPLPHRKRAIGLRRVGNRKKLAFERVASPVDPERLAGDVAGLPEANRLIQQSGLEIWTAKAEQIPYVLHEIGRLREETFRLVGEGTGRSLDLDRFDQHYLHLFLWKPETREVAGAYRLGLVDELMAKGGRDLLYTSTLFDLDERFVEHVNPGLELGRSFVRKEFQRSFLPLLMLWRGITLWMSYNPRYRRLFGPVSISAEHHAVARDLMVNHLRCKHFENGLAAWVKPRNPLPDRITRRSRLLEWTDSMLLDIQGVSAMVAELESDGKGVPVLLKEYLKLGGKMVGFNIDPDFNFAIDGLVLVDMDTCESRLLRKYMGRDGAQRFLEGAPEGETPDGETPNGA